MAASHGLFRMRSAAALLGLAAWIAVALVPARADAACLADGHITGIEMPKGCLSADDGKILRLRLFRADLVVAALACNTKSAYNSFVARHEGELVRAGKALKALFSRLHKARATRELDRFVTHLTNRASMRRMKSSGYCRAMGRVFDQALALPPDTLTSFVQNRPVVAALTPTAANDVR